MADTTSLEEKKVNPAAAYGHPDEVLNDQTLSREDKIMILREWYYDAIRLQESAAENMTGGEPDRLQSVSNALLKLGVSPTTEADPHAPEKDGKLRRGLVALGNYITQIGRASKSKGAGADRQ